MTQPPNNILTAKSIQKRDISTSKHKERAHTEGKVCKTSSKVLTSKTFPVCPIDNKCGLRVEDRNLYEIGDSSTSKSTE